MQTEIIRAHSPQRPVAHNFMQLFTEFDHYKVAADLDIATWDSYPLGALEEQWFDPSIKSKWLRTGHPDFASFNHDVYRGMSKLPFWVMEQQPGPVNWAHWNPAPLPGMVRLWSWEAFAHGAGCVSYFRWRQAPFAQEQMHAGLNTPDNRLDMGGAEASLVAKEIEQVLEADGESRVSTKVALVWDYEAKWLFEIHPQGADFHYPRFAFEYYSALRSLGLDVDVIPVDAPLDGYKMIVVPPLPVVPADFADRLAASGAQVVLGPRTGSKTANLTIPAALPPGEGIAKLIPIRVWRVESMRPNVTEKVDQRGEARHWRDFIETGDGALIEATFADGHPAIVRSGSALYLASLFDETLTQDIFLGVAKAAGINAAPLPEGIRISRRGGLTYVFNYNATPYKIPAAASYIVGQEEVGPQGVAIYRA